MSTAKAVSGRGRFPPWLKKRLPACGATERVHGLLKELELTTVCQSAHCPNQGECFAAGTATFMILGDRCTRNCGFCAVGHGVPGEPDPSEPERVADAAARLRLRHVVVTSVTRDDLDDGGAAHFRKTIFAVRKRMSCTIEVLTPDFQGNTEAVACVADARPDVFNHNLETMPRLYPVVRPAAGYARSLALLAHVRRLQPDLTTKSGVMVGLGETETEVLDLMRDLREVDCNFLTIGQYLRPSPQHLPLKRFVTPEEFAEFKRAGLKMGFRAVASEPFARSSYHAGDMLGNGGAALGTVQRCGEAPAPEN